MSKSRASKSTVKKAAAKKTTKAQATAKPAKSADSEMNTTEIRNLIDFIAQTGLNEVNIETRELKLHVKRDPDYSITTAAPAAVASVAPAPAPAAPAVSASQPAAPKPAAETASAGKTVEIKSPMIGTFYRSSSPDAPPFVSVGDKITKGQTVCIIEAMKLFNEIESEISGTVVKVMVENATPVEYDQVLFVVEPD